MKKINYILLLIFGIVVFNSCEKEDDTLLIKDGSNLAGFTIYKTNMGGLADGSEYTKQINVKLEGPTVSEMTGDVVVTIGVDPTSTAVEFPSSDPAVYPHFRIENKTITLKKSNNYLGVVDIILMTEGNTPPMDGSPEFDAYKAPVVKLKIASATGDPKVVPTGKIFAITLAFTPPNPYAGDYATEMRYFHPTAGGSYPDEPYGGVRIGEKTLTAVTGRKCETAFGVWTDLCWITVNADNSIGFSVDDTWTFDVKLGDPYDASKVSHFDPADGKIYMYYYYEGTGGPRVFWEVYTPLFK